jgi:tRNA threonylcarbamoyladenosine biosynthesis protein TsaE
MATMKFPFVSITDCTIDTESLGLALSELVSTDISLPRFVAMYGDLGVGKTAFVRGFCKELCPQSTVKSPTFALVNEYKCSQNDAEVKKVYHFDMYRISDEDDLYSIGFYDYLRNDAICIAEWCEMIPYALPDEYIRVEISKVDESDKRSVKIDIVQ